jgi:hypothetical protein
MVCEQCGAAMVVDYDWDQGPVPATVEMPVYHRRFRCACGWRADEIRGAGPMALTRTSPIGVLSMAEDE